MPRLIVDGMNVIGSRPTGWWRDRDGAARSLLAQLQALKDAEPGSDGELVLVLDGRPLPDVPEGAHGGVLVLYARRGGRNGADDRIVEEVAQDEAPEGVVVVTSDRELRERVGALGASVEGASVLIRRIEEVSA